MASEGSEPEPRACVLGAGSWGTALAMHVARSGVPTRLWTRSQAHGEELGRERVNRRYLPERPFPGNLQSTTEFEHALDGATLVICAIPSHGMRDTMVLVRAALDAMGSKRPQCDWLIAAKGIENDTLATMDQVLHETLPQVDRDRIAALGGPSFAAEVAAGLPTTVVVASASQRARVATQHLLSGGGMRAYETDDVIGVELGGALKNIFALAAGIGDGAGLGQNARAGLITRGLAEMGRLATALGGHPATLSGLAGLGDLVLTCTGGLSRNRQVGIALGQGKKLAQILDEMTMVAEGVRTTHSAHALAQREGVEMPIVATMHAILYEDLGVRDAVDALMGRELKAERG